MRLSNINLMKRKAKAGRRDFFFQYLLLFIVLLFSFYQYSVHRLYGFSVYPDEFGYWASAAQWTGYDWSDVASLGYYYSFGYGLLLAPVLWLFRDGVSAYRAAVFVNMALQCVSVGMLWGIFRRISCPVKSGTEKWTENGAEKARIEKQQLVFAVGTAVFYPAWTFYVQMTLAEALLAFLYVFICYQFVLLLENWKIRNVICRILLLSIAFLYLHFVHMRTVGAAAAAVLVLFFYLWQKPVYRKWLFLAGVTLIVGVIIGFRVKGLVTESVYAVAEAEHLAANDYTGKLRALLDILTPKGMKQFLQSCAGKLYYLGMASFGLFYPAVWVCLKRTFALLKDIKWRKKESREEAGKEEVRKEDWFFCFLLFSMMGQFLVSAVYMRGAGRLDAIIYGRYNEYMLPLFLGTGILVLLNSKNLWKICLCNIGISTVLFAVTIWTALQSESDVMRGIFATGLNYLSESTFSYQVAPEFVKAYLFGIFLMFLLTESVCIGRHFRQTDCAMAAVLMMEALLTICLCRKYIWTYNDSDYYDLRVYEYIEEYELENGGMPVSYLYGGGTAYIDLIQFAMRDKKIEIIRERDIAGKENGWNNSRENQESDTESWLEFLKENLAETGFLIVDYNSQYLPELEEHYEKCVESNSFVLFLRE